MLFLLMILGCVKELENQVIYKGNMLVGEKKNDLIRAAEEGRKSDIINFLRRGDDINEADSSGFTPLLTASQNGNKEIVELLLTNGASIDLSDKNGETSLYVASENGHKEVVELLLTKGASIDLATNYGTTPLYIASHQGKKEIVELLLSKGAVDVRPENIYEFISNKQNKTSDKLLLIRPNLHKLKDFDNKDENLVYSIFKCDDTELLLFILDTLKEDITLIDDFLLNIAALAIELKAFNCLKEVFFRIKDRKKIDLLINRDDLSQIVTLNKAEILAILAEVDEANSVGKVKGNDLPKNETIKKGEGNLIKAAAIGQVDDVLIFIEAGEDINELDENEQTPLYIASQNGHLEVAKILILKGASIDLANTQRITPLYKASQMGRVEIVELLLSNRADINLADDGRQTPIYIASQKGHTKVVELLIKNGADIDLADMNGWSPLFVATQYGNVEVVRLLISNGASISKATKFGETPLSLAKQHNYEEIIKILTSK